MPVTSFPVYIPVDSLGGWGTFAPLSPTRHRVDGIADTAGEKGPPPGVPVLPQFQLGKLPVESVEFISAEVTHK
jgi:hypothetical protein